MSTLRLLGLTYNKLSGRHASSMGYGLIKLKGLSLYGNEFDGVIPASISNASKLTTLELGENRFSVGNLSTSLEKFYALRLSGNQLTGTIPVGLKYLQKLQALDFSGNQLSGPIPGCLCKLNSLYEVYLERNRFHGSIPSCLSNVSSLRGIFFDGNFLNSSIPASFWNLTDLLKLNLSYNSLIGSLPQEIGNLKAVIQLDLSANHLCCSIPKSLGHLSSLEVLDLSKNNLSGLIPESLEALSYLYHINLSFNHLRGEIPSSGPFKNFTYESFIFDDDLCGAQRFHVPPCSSREIPSSGPFKNFTYESFIFNDDLCGAQRFHVPPCSSPWIHKSESKESISHVRHSIRISYYELVQATNGYHESNLLGKGSFGAVYKVLRNGCALNNHCLDLLQRLSIMIDVASALEYPHFGYTTPVVHCDLKPSNILLDENMVAYVSDFGMAKFLDEGNSVLHTRTLATLGYLARGLSNYVPLYGLEGQVSTRVDVYSFGIILIETFSRMKPNDEMFKDDLNLKDEHFNEKLECLSMIFKLALRCCTDCPHDRTNMKDAVAALQKIRRKLESSPRISA
ncbi:unnamed protein product [Coffea canephora]|uniref:Protein kinase domain-containing protein n=1 Tax=Coffea canephora TaxID=49390 RepID=A0A068VC57_COFCA|nr:unnamed protein product [Coffea canephora]